MKIHCNYDKLVPIGELKIHPKNRNVHPDDQIKRLAEILNYQGWRYPIKVSKRSGFVTSGHGRIEAARLNKWAEIPVNFQEYETEAQEFADLTADNAIASWSALDESAILQDYKSFEMELDFNLLGLKEVEIEEANSEGQCDPDEVPETPVEPKTKLGDLYELGNHRLLCGDSTNVDAVEKLMGGQKADMVFTDPPYGIELDTDTVKILGKNAKAKKYDRIVGDGIEFDPSFLLKFFDYCSEIYLWGADYYCQRLPQSGSWLVWDKRVTGHEDKVNYASEFEICWTKTSRAKRIIKHDWVLFFGMQKEDVKTRIHPNQKPVKLFCDMFPESPKKVVDLYLGSGSTLIACEKSGRRCFAMEIDPHYCDVIVSRYCKFTGNTKIKLNGEEIEWDTGITKPVQ